MKRCKRCGNVLMGSEELSETCNECLRNGFESMTDDEYDDYMERTENETKPHQKRHKLSGSANAYTLATPSHEGGMQTILAVSRYDLPVICGDSDDADTMSGTPGYTPDFASADECARHYKFGEFAEQRPRVEKCDECNTYPAGQQGLCRQCFDAHQNAQPCQHASSFKQSTNRNR